MHDIRIPFSGRNPEFHYSLTSAKPHILVLNKSDLVDRSSHNKIINKLKRDSQFPAENVILTNCKKQTDEGVKKIVPTAIELIKNSDRFNRSEEKEHSIMIIGVPNVGKSSLVNNLRNRHLHKKAASQVGPIAGITRSVLTQIKICEDPLIYLLDTPGVLLPNIRDHEMGMKLALCSCFQDHLVGEDHIADFLLYWLNKNKNFHYVDQFGLDGPTDDITHLLLAYSNLLGKTVRLRSIIDGSLEQKPDLIGAAKLFVAAFRNGSLGKFCLDVV